MPPPPDESYNTVAERIVAFRQAHPEGALQPLNPTEPFQVLQLPMVGDDAAPLVGTDGLPIHATYLVYVAAAYRSPEDGLPGIGVAYERYPGATPYTRDSELMNAETAAWGRAIVAALAADTNKGVATAEDMRARQEREDADRASDDALVDVGWWLAQALAADVPLDAPKLMAHARRSDAHAKAVVEVVGGRLRELHGQPAEPSQPDGEAQPDGDTGQPATQEDDAS